MTDNSKRIEKVCPVVLRGTVAAPEILAFRHPEAGLQLVKGTLEDEEAPVSAATRELLEESGLTPSSAPIDLGKSKGIEGNEAWHFFACPISGAPDVWSHTCDDDGGNTFEFFWQPLDAFIDDEEWHPSFIRAIRFVQGKLERMDAANRERLFPSQRMDLADTILSMAKERSGEKSLCPSEVARHLAGSDEKQWRALMKPIRAEAVRLAKQGDISITRKGKAVDPDSFKGVYRISVTD